MSNGHNLLYLKAFDALAQDLDDDAAALLSRSRKAAMESDYPGPNCLEPAVVATYVNEDVEITKEHLMHMEECIPCASLLAFAHPNAGKLEDLIQEARRRHESEVAPLKKEVVSPSPSRKGLIRVGNAVLNLDTGIWQTKNGSVQLTKSECKILELLAKNPGTPISRKSLLGHLRSYPITSKQDEQSAYKLSHQIKDLGKKLKMVSGGEKWIHSSMLKGYTFQAPNQFEETHEEVKLAGV